MEKSYRIKKICGDIFVIKSLLFLYRYLTVRTCSSVLLKRKRRGAYTASYGSTLRSISGSCKRRARRSSARTMPILFISRACRADARATRTLKNCRLYIGKIFGTYRNCDSAVIFTFQRNISNGLIFHPSIEFQI